MELQTAWPVQTKGRAVLFWAVYQAVVFFKITKVVLWYNLKKQKSERQNYMEKQFSRTELLLGKRNMEKLAAARVCIFGIGGVGGYVAEALARSGVGHLELVDNDVVCLSNLNRQIIATHETIGQYKVEVMKRRILSINPEAEVVTHKCFYLPETQERFDFTRFDYVVDAIDTIAGKIALAEQAAAGGTPVISSMGAGNKLDATAFQVGDIYETSVCPLAKVVRKELRKRGVKKLKVVYSRELPVAERQETVGSVAFVPSVAGLIIAGEVVKDLLGI